MNINVNKIFHLKNLMVFLFVLVVSMTAASPLYAEEAENISTPHEEIILNLNDLPPDESAHYAFLYGFQAILEKKCDGAFLTFTDKEEYVGGFLTEGAPDDFCVRISPDTITVSEPLQKDLAMAMYSMLGDRMSLSNLMNCEEKFLVGVIMFRPEEGMVVTPIWYAEAENRLKDAAVAQGLNPDEMYSIMEGQGYDKDSLIASVEKGVDPSVIALDAMKIKKDASTEQAVNRSAMARITIIKILLGCGVAVAVLLAASAIFGSIARKHEKEQDGEEL